MKLLAFFSLAVITNVICLDQEFYTWYTLKDALEEAKATDKLILFLINRSTCKPCKKLQDSLEQSKEFETLSQKFVLARSLDDPPADKKFNPDGKYVPKILFLTPKGVVLQNIINEKKKKVKYFYTKAEHVVESMNKALNVESLDRGFGKDYAWHDWETGLKVAKEEGKPILAVFHQDWCGACQRLKPKFAEASEVKELADKFVMVNTDNEEIVKGDKYKADGEYYPKILFLDSNGEHYKDEMNHGTKHGHVLHYYGEGAEIAASMARVLANLTLREKIEDNGFGKHIDWVKYEEGKKMAKEQNKPMMVIIHKSYCGACKALKPRVRNDPEIAELSKQFVMVNCQDDEEPMEDHFDIDGAYIPRIFFLDNLGYVESSIHNNESDYEKAKYAYGSAASIVVSMKLALEMNLGNREQPDEVKPGTHEEGFGTEITWYPYEEGIREAKKSHKAIMLVFYNDYCEFSRYMKQQFRDSKDIHEKSKKFVMIKVDEEQGKELGGKFDVDGTYTPRIFFMDPDQNVRTDVNNTDTPYTNTMFYYGKTEGIIAGMDLAIQKINLTLGRGFGEYIQWVKYEKALELAKEQNMPIMLIIHRQWCSACKALKPIIAESRPIWKLSYYFIMVNVEDDEEPLDTQYFRDGGYYPRVFFLSSDGKVQHEFHNRDPKYLKYKYSYGNEEQILISMKFAISKLSPYSEHYRYHQSKDADLKTTTSSAADSTTTPTSESSTEKKETIDTSKLTPGKKILAQSGNKFVRIDEALQEAKISKKPILFIIHRTTCPACKAVLKMIARDSEFKTKAEPFILADIEDDVDEKQADSYDVDGGYVPRIYFLDPEGNIFKEIWNMGTNYMDNKFYFYEMNGIYRAMEKTLEKMKDWKPSAEASNSTDNKQTTDENENTGKNKDQTKEKKDEL